MFLANLHASPRAHRSCLSTSSWRSVLKFHCAGTALMWKFDLYFTERSSFVFLDVCVTLRSAFVNRTRLIGLKTFRPFRKIDEESGGSVSWNTQPNCRASFSIATALLSPPFFGFLFVCSSTFLCGHDHLLLNLQPDSDLEREHSGGCQ